MQKYSSISKKFSKLKECCDFFKIKYNSNNLHTAIYDSYLLGKRIEKMYENEWTNDKKNKNSNIGKIKEIKDEYNKNNLNLEKHLESTTEENELETFIKNNIDLIMAEFEDKPSEKYLNDNI